MHGVPSRYSDFRDSMGRNNHLRWQLETYLRTDSLWSDFEEALAHIDGGAMLGVVDMWMDTYDAYDPDAQASDYFLAIDSATSPAQEIVKGNGGKADWTISWYSYHDLENIQMFVKNMGIKETQVTIVK